MGSIPFSNIFIDTNEIHQKRDNGTRSNQNEVNLKNLKISKYWTNFTYIHINGSWSTAAAYEWCSGDGSRENPYIIENITIDARKSPLFLECGILIENSNNDYFIIRNCKVYNGEYGIVLINSSKGILTNNNCSNTYGWGIMLWNGCQNNTISENFVCNVGTKNQQIGIGLHADCNYNVIVHNTAIDNRRGIILAHSKNNIISKNIVNFGGAGIYLLYSDYNNISENNVNFNTEGIYLHGNCYNNDIIGNIINNNYYGIQLWQNSNSNTNVLENILDNNKLGIYILEGSRANISGNKVFHSEVGIYAQFSESNTISGNTINEGGYGIYIDEGGYSNISRNIVNQHQHSGLYLTFSHDNIIKDNDVRDNNIGIEIGAISYSAILGNTLIDNKFGIKFVGWYNDIYDNYFINNDQGLYISGGENNIFYRNFFSDNEINAYDAGANNQWDSQGMGNLWDDYPGIDEDGNGIGDTPYNISGPAGSKDYYPIYRKYPNFKVVEFYYEAHIEETVLYAHIANIGFAYGGEITIQFLEKGVDGSTVIGTETIDGLKKDDIKIVSIKWKSKMHYNIIVIVDPYDTIPEFYKSDNRAEQEFIGAPPIIGNVRSNLNFFGPFFTGIEILNTFTAEVIDVDNNIAKVIFELNGIPKEGKKRSGNLWECSLNMGDLQKGDNTLKIKAIDDEGLESRPKTIIIKAIEIPAWLYELASSVSIGDYINIDIPHLIITIDFAIETPTYTKTVPKKVPGIGGEDVDIQGELQFSVKFYLLSQNVELEIYGKIGGEFCDGDYSFEVSIAGEASFKGFEIQDLTLEIEFTVNIKIWDLPFDDILEKKVKDEELRIFINKILDVDIGVGVEISVKLGWHWELVEDIFKLVSFYVSLGAYLKAWVKLKLNLGFIGGSLSLDVKGGLQFTVLFTSEGMRISLSGTLTFKWAIVVSLFGIKLPKIRGDYEYKFKVFSPEEVNETIVEYPWSFSENDTELIDSRPRVAAGKDGNAMMVWTQYRVENDNVYTDICYSEWNGSEWGDARYVTFDDQPDFDPALTYDLNGNVLLTWSRITGNLTSYTQDNYFDILQTQEIVYSIWNGSIWTSPQQITNDTQADGRSVVSSSLDGKAIAVWVGDADYNFSTTEDMELFYSVWNGSSWSPKANLTHNNFIDYQPCLAHDSNGNIMLSWIQDLDCNRTTTHDRKLNYAIWNGTHWTEVSVVTDMTEDKESPSLTFDSDDNAYITWVGGNENITRLYFAWWNKTMKEWSEPEIVHEDYMFICNPTINIDANNTAVIVWRGFEDDEEELLYFLTHNITEAYFDGDICYATKDLSRTDLSWSSVKYLTSDNKTDWMASAVIIRGHSNDLLLVWDKEGDVINKVHEIKPDLRICSSDITFSNQYPTEGDTIDITATIHNIGDVKAKNVNVSFYNGLPSDGDYIGSVLIDSLDYDDFIEVSVPWCVKSGSNDIHVEVDPDDSISEIVEDNNIASKKIEILPDLSVMSTDISFSNPNPQENEEITIEVVIHNQGGTTAENINVSFYCNNQSIGNAIISSLDAKDYELVFIDWHAIAGCNNITVIIDLENDIDEWNETNNEASKIIAILPDLEVNSITISEDKILLGETIIITAEIDNIGVAKAQNVKIEYFDGNPYLNGNLIFNETINMSIGETYTSTFVWTPPLGIHDIFVLVDGNDVITESDETNNFLYSELVVMILPDLRFLKAEIIWTPDYPIIEIPVENVGDAAATGVAVEVYDGDPLIEEIIIDSHLILNLDSGMTEIVRFPIYNPPESDILYLIIDFRDSIVELNENNNQILIIYSDIPILNAGADQVVHEGNIVQFNGEINLGNIQDYLFTWDFGDGITAKGISSSHQYLDDGIYMVTLTLSTDNYFIIDQLNVNVLNSAPTVDAGIDQIVGMDFPVSFGGVFSDPGVLDTHDIKWDFGDGSSAFDTLTPTHAYAIPGVYVVTLTITDDDGGIGTDSCTITVLDIVAPETFIDLSGDLGLESWYVTDVSISLSATDDGSGVAMTAYSFDCVNWIEYIGSFTIMTEGVTIIYYNSTDLAGNIESTHLKTVKIDKTAPETSLTYVQISGVGSIVTLSGSDPYSGVANIAYSLDEITWKPYAESFILSMGGIVPVFFNATDEAGNVEITKMNLVILDFLPPVTSIELEGILGLIGWYVSNVNVSLSAIDDIMGVDKITYSFDGITWIEYTTPFTITDEGLTTIYYRSVDNVGNIENINTEIIKIDKHPPDITITPSSQILTDGDLPVIFSWNVYDMSSILVLEIKLNDLLISNNPTGSYGIPNEIGIYNLSIYAEDIHGLSNTAFSVIEIIDDDSNPPELSNLIITHDIHNVNITLEVKDQSGIQEIIILVNGIPITPTLESQDGNTYSFILLNQWILKNGIYTVEVQVIDGDNDRPNDSLSASIFGTFEITLEDMYNYVDWHLEELKAYINENLCWMFRWILIRKLSHTQKHLKEAYYLIENGRIKCGMFNAILAKLLLEITEFRTEIFNKIKLINNEDAEHIINYTRVIRNNIVILMGASVGTEQAYLIALIEVRLLNLNDFIEEEINWCYSRCLRAYISSAARCLECAIIKLSMGRNEDCELFLAQWKLELVKNRVNWLLKREKISQELVEELLDQIENIQAEIENVNCK